VLKNYSLKEDLIHDIISGSTVGIMHIPQGMGYALIASLPAITGIYMAIYPVILYIIFGTSKHNSMGTFAVISILVSKVVLQHSSLKASLYSAPANGTLNDTLEMLGVEIPSRSPIEVGSALGFLCGIFQILFFAGRMGVLSAFLSDSLISGKSRTRCALELFVSNLGCY
jgi:solute carrier family 26, other